MMRAVFAGAVLLVAVWTFSASAIRAPELDLYQGGWNGTGTNCSSSMNDTRDAFITFLSDPSDSYIVITTSTLGGDLNSIDPIVILSANVIQARIDSYNHTSGYVSFTNVWNGANGPRGCLRIIDMASAPHKKRHGGPHAVGIQLGRGTEYCSGNLDELPDVAVPMCGDNPATTPRFYNLELSAYPCNSGACGLLLGEFYGNASVRSAAGAGCTANPYLLTDSYIKIYNVSGRVSALAFVNGPLPGASFDQPVPMVIKSYDAGTGQLQVQTFYSTLQCMTLNITRLAAGNFWASVPVGGTAADFQICPAAGTGVTGCTIGVYDFALRAPPSKAPSGSISVPNVPSNSASTVEIIVAYLTIAVVAVGLLVLQ